MADLCVTVAGFCKFTKYMADLGPKLRNKHGGPTDTETIWKAISNPKVKPGHRGRYCQMQTYLITKCAFHVTTPWRKSRQPCRSLKFLWRQVLLKWRRSCKASNGTWIADSRESNTLREFDAEDPPFLLYVRLGVLVVLVRESLGVHFGRLIVY